MSKKCIKNELKILIKQLDKIEEKAITASIAFNKKFDGTDAPNYPYACGCMKEAIANISKKLNDLLEI